MDLQQHADYESRADRKVNSYADNMRLCIAFPDQSGTSNLTTGMVSHVNVNCVMLCNISAADHNATDLLITIIVQV